MAVSVAQYRFPDLVGSLSALIIAGELTNRVTIRCFVQSESKLYVKVQIRDGLNFESHRDAR